MTRLKRGQFSASGRQGAGFTIVELLIVIVVIAVLAAITIVAYNGISNRAKASSAQSAAAQATKKVMAYAVENSDQYPADLASIGVTSSGSTSYQYNVNNSVNPRTYCVTATTSNVSYYESNTSGSPTAGACAGHGVNGVAAITNYALNPSFEVNALSASRSGGGTAPVSQVTSNTRSHAGTLSMQQTVNGTGQTGSAIQLPSTGDRLRVNEGESANWSFWVYSTKAGTFVPYCDGSLVVGGTYIGLSGAPSVSVPANTWTKVNGYGTRPAGQGDVYLSQCGGYNLAVVLGDVLWYDEFIVSNGLTQQTYADGSSSNWVWNGTAQNSTSTGPAL